MKRISLVLFLTLLLSGCTIQKSSEAASNNGQNSIEETSNNGGAAETKKILHGQGAPASSLGQNFDHYYDETSQYVYEKNDGEWINTFTKGSPSLYSNGTQRRELHRALESIDLDILKNALATSFYTTNGTVHMIPHWPEGGGWDFLCEFSKQEFKVTADTQSEHPFGFDAKMGDDGVMYVYNNDSGTYVEADDNHYCMLPHPTIDNISFTNYLMFDDTYGQQTSIVCANLDRASYSEGDGYYSIENIEINHAAISSHYYGEPQADHMVINFRFKLSEDKSYVERAFLTFVESEAAAHAVGLVWEFHFYNMHCTEVTLPQ